MLNWRTTWFDMKTCVYKDLIITKQDLLLTNQVRWWITDRAKNELASGVIDEHTQLPSYPGFVDSCILKAVNKYLTTSEPRQLNFNDVLGVV